MITLKRNGKEAPYRPTSKLLVHLHSDGVLLLNPHDAPPFYLSYPDLQVISGLYAKDCSDTEKLTRKVAKRTGAELHDLNILVHHLTRSGRIRRQQERAVLAPVSQASLRMDPDQSWLDSGLVAVKVPLALRGVKDRFQLIDHDGQLLVELTPPEVFALAQFVRPVAFREGVARQERMLGKDRVNEKQLRKLLALLDAAGLVSRVEGVATAASGTAQLSRAQVSKEKFNQQAAEQDARAAQLEKETGVRRPKVIPVWFDEGVPTALGLVYAYAKAYGNGFLDEFYDFRLDWIWDDDRLEANTRDPAIYLCSNYLWSHERCIAVSQKVKSISPDSITIHGGPDTPKYEQDALEYFEQYPHVDIVVRGEGEASAADTLDKLRQVIGQKDPDLHSVLADVPGISYRHNGKIYRNPDRERIADLDTVPSPFITGLFDVFEGVPRLHVTLETNRGCPYGCTFCDWGSATTSKIRKFDIDRVYGEIEWCSKMKVESVSQADANFGVFERDVDIAAKVAEVRQVNGYPVTFGGSYAKNSTKYLERIIKIMAEAGILTQGVLSLQTMDDNTLAAIKRSNIKVAKYDALANEMRASNLQLTVELMMGLPGATLEGFIEDLQQCIDRDVQARINHTTMLVNAPMNEPAYREKHQIETGTPLGPGKMPVLVSTSTYTRQDLGIMLKIRQLFILLDNFGVLRLVSRFVHQQTGMSEMDFYNKLLFEAGAPEADVQWPLLNTLVNDVQNLMAPVYSWKLVMDELRAFIVEACGVADDGALQSVLAAQHALLPAHGRQYPMTLELQHDVAAWYSTMIAAKSAGHRRDWIHAVPALETFGPGTLTVDDVDEAVTRSLGCNIEMSAHGVNWDMQSDVARARVDMEFNYNWTQEETVVAVQG